MTSVKTGQQIHDYIEKHPDYDCAKKCLWLKLDDVKEKESAESKELEK